MDTKPLARMDTKTSDSGTSKQPAVYSDVDHAPVTSVLPEGDVPYTDHEMSADERVIMVLGYKQEFRREFSLWSTFCVSFAVLGLLSSFASTLYYVEGMGYAGTAGMVWGWIITLAFIQYVAMSMAGLCSAMPTSGGLYYAPAITAAPSVDYSLAAMILAAGSINNPNYVPTSWQTFLLTALIMIIHTGISSLPTKRVTQFNSYGSTFNFLALVTTLIAIPVGTKNSPEVHVVARGLEPHHTNLTDFPDGVAVLMTFLVVAYTVVAIEAVIDSDLGQPWASYLLQVLPARTAMAILALTILCGFSMGQGCMVAASRVTYARARDDCFPLSRLWKQVHLRTATPVNAVILNAVLGILMCLLILAGDVAIGALFSIGSITQFVAFSIPIAGPKVNVEHAIHAVEQEAVISKGVEPVDDRGDAPAVLGKSDNALS
ncbi:GABA/polyamine transporter [Penicillium alfredii]|uniref:GABA/polyamine transporter n=1 Tax=Penicillium alfredii TaxID=1506179 RepID=A0A9W9EH49_9EURO|nr:GABA/polyamine transporter [Penicillium alfredii]KAJ5081708.1 GABA/polyamine transporter [Penicillium alfredii]